MRLPFNIPSIIPRNIPSVPSIIASKLKTLGARFNQQSEDKPLVKYDHYAWDDPFIMINKFAIDRNNIRSFSIFTDAFLPRIRLELMYDHSYFEYLYLPRKGDRVNVLLKSETNAFYEIDEEKNEIRCDFIINTVETSSHPYGVINESEMVTLVIEGQLFVPELFKKVTKVWKDKSSKDVLLDIAETLKLGYKINFENTDDNMNWLCPMETYYDMIQYVTNHAWIDEDAFFESYIDLFYNLNFINVNDVLDQKPTKEEEKKIIHAYFDYASSAKRSKQIERPTKVFITNSENVDQTNYYITSLNFNHRLDAATVFNAEERTIVWYNSDGTSSDKKDNIIKSQEHREPYFTNTYDDPHDKVLKKVRQENWAGLEYQLPEHNVHKNYKNAEWNNFQKKQDFHLFEMTCFLKMFNHIIQKSDHLYVLLFMKENMTLMYLDETKTDMLPDEYDMKVDKIFSGAYYIRGINYHWVSSNTEFRQEVMLFRKTKAIDPRRIMRQ